MKQMTPFLASAAKMMSINVAMVKQTSEVCETQENNPHKDTP